MNLPTTDLVGEKVGDIRLVDVLGRGGMGIVYVGRDEKLNRRVAVKAIHGELRLHERAKARFQREAQILSKLNHRNVCVVHGLLEHDDSDFLVLELVPGANLRAAIKGGLSERQKFDIARQLLEVLAEVHDAGVIHRDLKPENIMVKPDGEIAVLDFGLARSAEEDLMTSFDSPTLDLEEIDSEVESGETLRYREPQKSTQVRTRRGTVVGTAGYLSPEQARAEPTTSASDMYSVGLILQELFMGSRPFDRNLGTAVLVAKAAVAESEPVVGLAADLTALIERLKSPAPGSRPSAADALAQLDRIIDKPRRQRRRTILAAVWFALLALAVGMTFQWIRASREANRANTEAMAAQQVSDFLVNLFEESNPEQARGASLSAEEILKRGAERVGNDLEDQPLTRARLSATIGRVYSGMGLYSQAIPFAEEAVALREQQLGPDHAEVAEALALLGTCQRMNGDLENARTTLQRSLEIRERLFGSDHLEVANSLLDLGSLEDSAGRLAEAEVYLRRALSIFEVELGPDEVETSKCLANLAIVAARQGRVEEVEPIFRRVLAIQEKALGDDHPTTTEARQNHAIALKILGRYDEAEELYRRNLEIQERILGSDHPEVAANLQNFAVLYSQTEQYDKAEPLYLRSLEIRRAALSKDHPEVALALYNLGSNYIEQGRWLEAEAACEESLAIRERILDPGSTEIALTVFNLGRVNWELGRVREADAMYRESLAMARAALPSGHPHRLNVVRGFVDFLRATGRDAEADEIEAEENGLDSTE